MKSAASAPRASAFLYSVAIAGAILASSSCRTEKTYAVDVRNGTRYVHNLEPASKTPVAELRFVRKIGELEGKDPNYQFARPMSAAEDGKGNLFVLDDKDGTIKKFDADRKFLLQFGRKGQGPGELVLSIDRTLPFKVSHLYGKSQMDVGGKVVFVDEPDFTPVNRGIGIDSRGRIWVLSVRKALSRSQTPREYDFRADLAFEIYSPEGVLLSRIPFPREVGRFDNMTMRGDHVFFVDPFDQACVYEYAVADLASGPGR